MVKNLINVFIAVGLLLLQLLGLAVGLLRLLQLKPHTTNTGFIRSLISKLGSEGTPETPELWQSVGFVDEDLVPGREDQKHGVEIWNWRVCQWGLQTIKDSSILSLKVGFFFIILWRKTRSSVCSSVCFALTIIYLKMIVEKLLSPADLAKTWAFCIHELLKVIVVSENKNFVFAIF